MATPAERAKAKQHHRHGRRHHQDPARVAVKRREAKLRAGGWRGGGGVQQGVTYGVSAYGWPGPVDVQGSHLNQEQFGDVTGVGGDASGGSGDGGTGGDAGGAT